MTLTFVAWNLYVSRVSRRWRAEGIDAAFWLFHHFFDGHVREVLRVEHEAVVLVELGEAEARLVVRVEFLRVFQKRKKRRD